MSSYQAYESDSVTPSLEDPFFLDHVSRYYWIADSLRGGERVLDVACGKGYGSAVLATRAGSVLGVDLNPASIEVARATYGAQAKNLEFRLEDVIEGDSLRGGFDVVVACEIIEHLPAERTDAFLSALKRATRPGGRVIISTPNHEVVRLAGVRVPEFHINNLTADELRACVSRHFKHARFLGQYRRKGGLRDFAFAMDRWNLRHRLRARWVRPGDASVDQTPPQSTSLWSPRLRPEAVNEYVFAEWIYPQSGLILSEATND